MSLMDITSIVCMVVPTSKMTGCSAKASSSSSTFVSPANSTVEPVNSSLRVAIALPSATSLGCHPVTCGIETTVRPLLSHHFCHPASSVLNGAIACSQERTRQPMSYALKSTMCNTVMPTCSVTTCGVCMKQYLQLNSSVRGSCCMQP